MNWSEFEVKRSKVKGQGHSDIKYCQTYVSPEYSILMKLVTVTHYQVHVTLMTSLRSCEFKGQGHRQLFGRWCTDTDRRFAVRDFLVWRFWAKGDIMRGQNVVDAVQQWCLLTDVRHQCCNQTNILTQLLMLTPLEFVPSTWILDPSPTNEYHSYCAFVVYSDGASCT